MAEVTDGSPEVNAKQFPREWSQLLIAQRFALIQKVARALDSFEANFAEMQRMRPLLLGDDQLTQDNAETLCTSNMLRLLADFLAGQDESVRTGVIGYFTARGAALAAQKEVEAGDGH